MAEPKVVLVDENDTPIGEEGKLRVHQKGLLHRAFSVCIFNSNNEILLQQRALGKYHTPGLWTNACCSHPIPGQPVAEAASKRLMEEMGFTCKLTYQFKFIYKAEFSNGLTEHELDHVFTGTYDGPVNPHPGEVNSYKFVSTDELIRQLMEQSDIFTPWFRLLYIPLMEKMNLIKE